MSKKTVKNVTMLEVEKNKHSALLDHLTSNSMDNMKEMQNEA
jgi:hypothetical protein